MISQNIREYSNSFGLFIPSTAQGDPNFGADTADESDVMLLIDEEPSVTTADTDHNHELHKLKTPQTDVLFPDQTAFYDVAGVVTQQMNWAATAIYSAAAFSFFSMTAFAVLPWARTQKSMGAAWPISRPPYAPGLPLPSP